MRKWKTGIIGCGTIGSELACALVRQFGRYASLTYLCDQDASKAASLLEELPSGVAVASAKKIVKHCDLVIEAAHSSVAGKIARDALALNKHVMVMSVGGLLNQKGFSAVLKKTRGRLWIPSGALAGVDALLAAAEGRVDRVTLITRKPVGGLKKAPFFRKHKLPSMTRRVRIFSGNAAQAVRLFPQNVNVAAVLSLAGIGAKRTRVEIWTVPNRKYNEHEVVVEGKFGTVRTVSRCMPAPGNPRTSYLAALSAVAMLRKIFSSVRIGT